MMFKRWLVWISAAALFMLTACSSQSANEDGLVNLLYPQKADSPETKKEENNEKITTLTIWSYEQLLAKEIIHYEAAHTNIKIKMVVFPNKTTIKDQYIEALATGHVPDIMILSKRMLGAFNSLGTIENLLQPPYSAGKYKDKYTHYLWSTHLSLDQSKLIAMPYQAFPLVTFYRADLLKDAGFPSEPEPLADYMEEPERLIAMADTLAKRGMSIVQWPSDALSWLTDGHFFYNRALEYQGNSAVYLDALKVARQLRQYPSNYSVWETSGQQAMDQNKLIMFTMPEWAEGQLKKWVPEQAGQWRMTRLPLGINSMDLGSSRSFVIPSDARHKELAWNFIEASISSSGVMNWHKSPNKKDFLGGQDVSKVLLPLLDSEIVDVPTPLDDIASGIWETWKEDAVYGSSDERQFLNTVKSVTMEQSLVDQRLLLKYGGTQESSK